MNDASDRAAQLQEPLVKADATVSDDRVALSAQRRLRWAIGFVAVFMVTEIIGGVLANSLAIITDAAHMMSDMGGFLVSMFSLALVSKKATQEYSFGYHQAEVIGALISVLMVWLLTGMLLIEAFGRFQQPQDIDGALMFGLACLGLVVNLILMKTLGHGHSHGGRGSHGHSHSHGGGHDHAHGGGGHNHTHGRGKKKDHSHGDSGHGHSHGVSAKNDHSHEDSGHGHSHGANAKSDHPDRDSGNGHSHNSKTDAQDRGHMHSHSSGSHGHGHDANEHGHGHGDDLENPREEDAPQYQHDDHGSDVEQESLAMQAALAHVIGDIVQSAGVIVASVFIWTRPFDIGVTAEGISNWNYADPICTVLFAVLVILTTKSTIIGIMRSLMFCAPERVSTDSVLQNLLRIPHVVGCHDIHIWEVGRNPVFTAHVLVDKQENSTSALHACIACMKSKFNIDHATIQIEIEGEFDHDIESYGLLHDHSTCCDK